MARHVEAARRILAGPDSRLVFVVHSNDLHHHSLRRSLACADLVLCRSNSVADQLRRLTGHECDGIVYSGIPEREFCDFGAKRWGGDTLRVVMASKFIATKNIEPSLAAIAMVARRHPVRVDLYGDGEIRARVDAAIERLALGDIVVRHGFQPRARVLEAMFRADLFLMPSTIETLGLAYLEAMANGCVVVGLRGWGIDGIVTDGVDGFLAASSAPEDIAERIEAYLAADRAALHARAYALARRYTADNAARNYAEHVGRVLA
ncbi:glycosyltransferase family 4 protein [Halomonas getboli]|uniref:glycosyltransferase family 4 protein n=1 Tax=Halomonas getboli TaxID=2935862 RepID=UPI00200047B0|nr:glycosyltransferase family 4 protein [Halomonas getboli]MCK2183065.1 glycosyltransferase family 4 protein [Halomonas getboli]